jgi:miniconductance mechanosensitive channel
MVLDIILRVALIALLTVGAYLLTRWLLARFALPLLRHSRPTWAKPVERSKLPMLTALLAAVLALGVAADLLAVSYPQVTALVRLFDTAAGIAILAFMLTTTASIGLVIYDQQPLAKEVPLAGFVQLIQGGIFLIGALMIVAVFLGVPAIYSLAALAAIFTALGFVFQDPIMGFVAGIQLAANKMVAIGDWIEVPQFGANGAVQEILMSTVKVQNWDNTVTTVPTRALISDSFKSWRSMTASGGRRLQRSVLLDVHAVRPLTRELAAKLPVMAGVWQQIVAGELAVDGILASEAAEEPTNLGVYRVYLTYYLRNHPHVNQEMMCMVRQLQVTEDGLPLEVYAFLLDTGWPLFETTASSIFEHLFATLPQFGLRPFQRPRSVDIGDPLQAGAA